MSSVSVNIADASWFRSPNTKRVMEALEDHRPNASRYVGGCIRNTLLGEPVSDIDIATQLKPEDTIKALNAANIRAIPTGIEHGTITAISEHEPFEITSLRRDVETDGRRAIVAFTEDWNEDAQRRDFRINALYADMRGDVHDPTGGLPDIDARRIVFIGDAEQRLREDHLRNLRFFRFTAWYGNSIDEVGLNACEHLRDGLKQIAAERIWKELFRLLGAPNPFGALRAMVDTGVIDVLLPEYEVGRRLSRLEAFEKRHDLKFDAFQRFQTLIPKDDSVAQNVSIRLRLSNAERDRLTAWAKAAPSPEAQSAFPAWAYRQGEIAAQDQLVSEIAECVVSEKWLEHWRFVTNWKRPDFPISGKDLIAAGINPGPDMGKKLNELENAWIENGFSMDGVNFY